jgi:hypothetical protein
VTSSSFPIWAKTAEPGLNGFGTFDKLPRELRNLIWTYAIPDTDDVLLSRGMNITVLRISRRIREEILEDRYTGKVFRFLISPDLTLEDYHLHLRSHYKNLPADF